MARANTMAGTSGAEFDALTDTIRGLSSEIPMAREALAEGLYETVSNGVPKDNWIDYLRAPVLPKVVALTLGRLSALRLR